MDAPSEPGKKADLIKKRSVIVGIAAILIAVSVLLVYWGSPSLTIFPVPEDTDGDGVYDESDAFPLIASQWSDLDKDGFGDNLNGITPDRFPNDYTQWFDFDRDGYGDNPDGIDPDDFPADPTQWRDVDDDGYGDNANGTGPDAFPFDSGEWKDTDGDGCGDNSDAYPNNPMYWWTGHATFFVDVVSRHNDTILYGVYLNGHGSADGHLKPWSSNLTVIEFEFPCGLTNNISVEVMGESVGFHYDVTSDSLQLWVEPDMTYFVRLNV